MGNIKQINIKNWTYYFFNDMINIKDFHSILLKIYKKSYKNISIYNTWYIIIKPTDDYENINCVNPLHLVIGEVDGYIEVNSGNEYLIFDSTDKNKEILTKYAELWDKIGYLIKTINGGKAGESEKEFMKIKFNLGDNLPLNKALKLHMLPVIVRCIFEKDSKYYPQFF